MSLPKYRGREVTRAAIKITKAGDGLSDALHVEPVVLDHNDQVYLVLRCEVIDVQHPFADKKARDALVRKCILETVDVAIVDESDVAELLIKNKDRVQRGLDAIAGQGRLDDESGDGDGD